MTDETEHVHKQELFHLAEPIGNGEDENGEFQLIPLSMIRGGELKPFKVYTKPMKHIVNDSNPSLRGWYKNKAVSDRQRPRPCYSEAVLTVPYGGYCHVGCKFCYVDNGTRGYRATGIPTVSPDYPDNVAKQIKAMMIAAPFYISSFTEPFQILEDDYHIVRRLTDVLVNEDLPLFYLSRRIPPDWAVEALQQNPYSYMQWSINSSDTAIYKKMSPGSYKIDEVMASMKELSSKGIYISIQCNPVLPGIVSLDNLKHLIELIADNGGNHVIFKFAEQVMSQRKMLIERLQSAKLKGVGEFDAVFNQVIGGVYTVNQEMRVDWLNELLIHTRKHGITMSTCYEYYDDGKGGANMAPYFTTSDQCHGRGVPMFYRPAPGAVFKPLPGCYRKGCLYCAEHGTQACGNDTLLQAKALEFKDYKSITLQGDEKNWAIIDSCKSPDEVSGSCACNDNFQTDMEIWSE